MTLVGINKNIAIAEIRDRVSLLIRTMEDSIRKVVNDNNSDFNKESNEVSLNLFSSIITNTIDEEISTLFEAYDLVGNTARDKYLLARELFAFGEDQTVINNAKDISESLKSIDLDIQLKSLGLAFENASEIEFNNQDDLQLIIDQLDAEFERLRDSALIDEENRINLINIRTSTLEFFTTIDLANIKTIDITQKPSRLISYENYGISDNSDLIVSLNKSTNTPFISGSIKVLSNDTGT